MPSLLIGRFDNVRGAEFGPWPSSRAAAGARVRLEILREEAQRRESRSRRHLDEAAIALAPGERGDLLDLRGVVARLARGGLLKDGRDGGCLHPARRALTALRILEKTRDRDGALDDACALFNDGDAAAPQVAPGSAERFVRQGGIEARRGQERARQRGEDRLDGAAAGRATAEIIHEGAQRGPERDLDDAGPREAVVERAEHCAGPEPLRAVAHDAGHPRERLDVLY